MNLREIYDSYLAENLQILEKSKSTPPHLALCIEDNPSANNRPVSLLTKSTDNKRFELFKAAMADEELLLNLYIGLMGNPEAINNIIKSKGK